MVAMRALEETDKPLAVLVAAPGRAVTAGAAVMRSFTVTDARLAAKAEKLVRPIAVDVEGFRKP